MAYAGTIAPAPVTAPIQGAPAPTSAPQKAAATVYDYNTGKPLAPGQAQSTYNSNTGDKIGTPTVLSSTNIDTKNQDNTSKIQNMGATGQTVGPDGVSRNADGSPADAPPGATATQGEDGNTYYSDGAIKYATQTKVSDDPYTQGIYDQLSQLKGSMDATGAANIANIQAQYGSLIETQKQVNQSQEAGVYSMLARGGSLQTDSSSGIMQSQISFGIRKIGDLVLQEQDATVKAQQAAQDGDYKVLDKQLSILADARKQRADAAQKVSDNILKAKKDAQDRLDATDKQIQSAMLEAQKGGATPEAMKAMQGALASHDYSAALTAGAQFFQDPTSSAGQYAAYVKSAQAKGLTPMTPGDFLAKQKSSEAYSSAYASAKAKNDANTAAGLNADGSAVTPITPDPHATGITAAAGISLQAFNYLTQGTASMTRMPAAQRNQIMKEANDFLNKKGLDISTFQSQYKAYNDVLQHNLERANNTKIFAGEITGTVDQFVSDIGTDFSKLKVGNVAKLLAGEQTNDPTAQKYAFDIQTLQNDLAGYYAASRTGAANATPDDSDKRAAAQVIQNGINEGSATAFRKSIVDNETKVTGVVGKAAEDAQKQVWDLFGVGAQYKAPAPQVNPKDAVDEYVTSNPDKAENIAKLYDVPGATDQDVLDYIKLLPK